VPKRGDAATRPICPGSQHTDYIKVRTGKFSDKRAWIEMVVEHLNDERLRKRRFYTRITGRAAAMDADDNHDKW
jgi:hypothetical protein